MELRAVAGEVEDPRIGIIVPKHSHTAVARNRVKRRLREIVRTEEPGAESTKTAAIVIFALPAAYEATFAELRAELRDLQARAKAQ